MTLRGPDKLPASQLHFKIFIGDDSYYVVGGIQHGRHGASFQPSWLFDDFGHRCRVFEAKMTKEDWDSIQSQVEEQLDNE